MENTNVGPLVVMAFILLALVVVVGLGVHLDVQVFEDGSFLIRLVGCIPGWVCAL